MLHQHNKHWWFSGRILACHAGDRGSIPRQCKLFFISNTYQVLCKCFSSNRWLGKMLNIFVICQVFFIANSKQTADSDSFLFHTTLHCNGCDENSNTGLYNNEPEYSKEEYKKRKLDSSSDMTDSDDNLDSSRLENLHWCTCKKCVIGVTMTLDECKCCRECNIYLRKHIYQI